jgi:hypothetical protein
MIRTAHSAGTVVDIYRESSWYIATQVIAFKHRKINPKTGATDATSQASAHGNASG